MRPESFRRALADIESHPDTADLPSGGLIDLVEAVEDPVSLVGIDPRSSVSHSDNDVGVDADGDGDPLVRRRVLDIVDEVAHDAIDVFDTRTGGTVSEITTSTRPCPPSGAWSSTTRMIRPARPIIWVGLGSDSSDSTRDANRRSSMRRLRRSASVRRHQELLLLRR